MMQLAGLGSRKWQARKWLCLFVLFGWLCLICNLSQAQSQFQVNALCQVNIEQLQKVQSQDPTQVPIAGWQAVSLPDNWQHNWKDYHGGAWYKVVWHWSCKENAHLAEPIAFSVDYINSAGAMFLNGELLWSDQNLQEPLSKSWNMPRYWILPIRGLNKGSNEILIYVQGYSFQKAGLGQIEFNNVLANNQQHLRKIWDRRTLFQINIIFSAIIGVICFILWLFRRSETTFGWLALSSLFWILFISNVLTTESLPFRSSIWASKAHMIFFIAYIHCFCLYLIRFLQQKFKRLELYFILINLGWILLICFSSWHQLHWVLPLAFIVYRSLFVISVLYVTYQAVHTRNGEYIFLAVCLWSILFIIAVDWVVLSQTEINNFSPLSPYTPPVMILFVVLILCTRLNRNISKIENFNLQLERKVRQVSTDLNKSLNDKHKLELDNVRLQERINLSHELHDGLGASIVRAILLVDQSTDVISNQQFLSILKLLRDDLRQIVDSGSSIDNEVPGTPILWIAPVRYRFTQLMEEMNIAVEWIFPKVWQREPTALQCLTLIRVMEESLTNIIKHSQASRAKVGLEYSRPHQLTLSIQDNGIGFNTEIVQKNGLSIGMRSMKMRVERMGGVFQVESVQGNTQIRVVLELYQP